MAARKNPETRAESNLTEAAEKASLVIRGLQSRLRQRPEPIVEETPEDLERQLQQYFSRATSNGVSLIELRDRVVDGVAARILRQWDQGTAIEGDVVDRLIDRVLERLSTRKFPVAH